MTGFTLHLTPLADSTIENIKKEFEQRGMTEAIEVVEKVQRQERLAVQGLTEICMNCHIHLRACSCKWKTEYFHWLAERQQITPPGTTRTEQEV